MVEHVGLDVVGPEPGEAPHVFSPPDHLTDHSLGRAEGDPAGAVGLVDQIADLAGEEQPEVQIRAEQRMRQVPVVGNHGILVGSKTGQDILDEVTKPGACAAP